MASNDIPTVGLIGCGAISRVHLTSYDACGMDVKALCDIDLEHAKECKEKYELPNAELYTDYKELLARDDIDLVSIATPVSVHAPLVLAALEAGKHVACEKPSTVNVDENHAIIKAADKAKRHVLFFSSRQRWGAAELAYEYISNGELGDIYKVDVRYYREKGRPGIDFLQHADWFLDKKRAGGGIVMDMGQYFMDMVFHLTNWPDIKTVSATTFKGFPYELPENVVYDVEEHASIMLRADDISFSFDFANYAMQPSTRSISILGTRGGIVMDDEHYFRFITERGDAKYRMQHTSSYRDNTNHNIHIYNDMIKAIQGDDPGIGTTPRQALKITQVTEMAYQSAEQGREIKI